MTDAYPPNDPHRMPADSATGDDAVFDTTTVPTAGGTAAPTHSPPLPSGGGQTGGLKDTAQEAAASVGDSAKDAGSRVGGAAQEEAHNIASEAKHQARQLFDTTMQEARDQASTQQHRAAEGMRTMAGDLNSMAAGEGGGDGLASQLIGEAGNRIEAAASWMSEREPADLLDELKRYARRHPVTFIAVAGVAGLLVGRLTRGLIADAKDDAGASGRTTGAASSGTATAGPRTTLSTGTAGRPEGVPAPSRHSDDQTAGWVDEPVTGAAASDPIYGARPTEERGL